MPWQQGEVHRRALDVERLVVLDRRDGREGVDIGAPGLDHLAEELEIGTAEELPGLLEIGAAAVDGEGERLEPGRTLSGGEQLVVEGEQQRAAVDAAGEEDAQGLGRGQGGQPEADLLAEGADVGLADDVEVRRQHLARRIEEAPVDRVGIGAADELDLGDVVGRDHPRVGGMELVAVPLALQRVADLVDAVGDHQHRAVLLLGQEVAQRAVEAARQAHPLAVAGEEGEGALDPQDVGGVLREQEGAGVVHGKIEDLLVVVGDEVEDAGDGLVSQGGASPLRWRGF